MRDRLPDKLEAGRVVIGEFASDPSWGPYGCFFVWGPRGAELKIISSGGEADDPLGAGWEHVSVSTERRCPNWEEMCFVKSLFWGPEECVVQFHPPESDWVNNHPYCLHLWRHKTEIFPRPPSLMVGVRGAGELTRESARVLRDVVLKRE